MTTTVHDFGSPIEQRAAPPPLEHPPASASESSARMPPRSPLSPRSSPHARDDAMRDGRGGGTVERVSSRSSRGSGVRYRRPTRSSTVRSYHSPERPKWQPGAEPGIDTAAASDTLPAHLQLLAAPCEINIVDFADTGAPRIQHCDNASLAAFLAEPRPADMPCRWISVNGLSWDVIRTLGNQYNLHRLAIEDLVSTHTRTKVDWYADHAFVVLTLQKLVRLHLHAGPDGSCDCPTGSDARSMDEKQEPPTPSRPAPSRSGWWPRLRPDRSETLPRYLDDAADAKVDELVPAHSGVSEHAPIKPIRTLHRYESAQIPGHTAFMEQHSVLAEEDLAVSVEQVAIFLLADNMVISFFEQSADDVEAPILDRLGSSETMLSRSCDASLLLQAIVDAIVDLAVPIKDAYNKVRKELQVDAMTTPNIKTSRSLHIFGEEIDMLQNLFKPIVLLVNALRDHNPEQPLLPAAPGSHARRERRDRPTKRDREGVPMLAGDMAELHRSIMKRSETATNVIITPLAHTYFGDVLDHCITMIQALEQMDASASNISTLIFNTVGARTNYFMMILAIVTVLFAPLTFISGYFGMNFASGSGLAHPFGFFWVVATPSLVAFMLLVFATMLWDNIRDFLEKRGFTAHRRRKRR